MAFYSFRKISNSALCSLCYIIYKILDKWFVTAGLEKRVHTLYQFLKKAVRPKLTIIALYA